MKSESADKLHQAVNLAFWFSNPDWSTHNKALDTTLAVTRPFWRVAHNRLMSTFFDTDKVLAINGESVVAKNGDNLVDKHMFRHPKDISIEEFEASVREDVGLVTRNLAGVALPTLVSIKPAYVFRNPETHVQAVTQTQRRLDLDVHSALNLDTVLEEAAGKNKDRTAKDLELVLTGAAILINEFGRYPDIARSSGNLRRSQEDGSITLIDVMPFYDNGSRAIGDRPKGAIESMQHNLARLDEFVGSYGA